MPNSWHKNSVRVVKTTFYLCIRILWSLRKVVSARKIFFSHIWTMSKKHPVCRWEKSGGSSYLHSRCPLEDFEEYFHLFGKAVFYLISGQQTKDSLLNTWKILAGLSKLLSTFPQKCSEKNVFFFEEKMFFFPKFQLLERNVY